MERTRLEGTFGHLRLRQKTYTVARWAPKIEAQDQQSLTENEEHRQRASPQSRKFERKDSFNEFVRAFSKTSRPAFPMRRWQSNVITF